MIKYEALLKNTKAYQGLMSEFKRNKLNHCYMIISEDSVAVENFCKLIARAFLCKNDNCGCCVDCIQFDNEVHPSLIVPDKLDADGIRNLISDCAYAIEGDKKIVLITNFQDIKLREQNRLLKLIEEPVEGTIYILGVSAIANVLETIKSRATKVNIETFDNESLFNALSNETQNYELLENSIKFSDGSLQKAITMINDESFVNCYNKMIQVLRSTKSSAEVIASLDALGITSRTQSSDVAKFLDALEIIMKQIIEYKNGINEDVDGNIMALSIDFNTATIVNIFDLIIDCRQKLLQYCDPVSTIEGLLMKILEVKYQCR